LDDINVQACAVIRYPILSQKFYFCCFRAMAYIWRIDGETECSFVCL